MSTISAHWSMGECISLFTHVRASVLASLSVPRDGGEVDRSHVHIALIEFKVRCMGDAVALVGIRQPREVEREVVDLSQDEERTEILALERTICRGGRG